MFVCKPASIATACCFIPILGCTLASAVTFSFASNLHLLLFFPNSTNETSKMPPPPNISLFMNSIDSTQGYQDSDDSPVRIDSRKKKMLHQSSFKIKTRNSLRRSSRRKSHPYVYCDACNDSSNSSHNGPVEIVVRQNSSPNTDVYKSESYQLLMPQHKNSRSQLDPIDETVPINSNTYFVNNLESMSTEEMIHNNFNSHSGRGFSDIGSSSNISLPMSPELSVVENISISKDILHSIDYYPTINEMQSNDVNQVTGCSKYMISDVDVSVPLMEQDCGLENCSEPENDKPVVNITEPKSVVTESLVSKIGTINIEEQVTATDTLNQKLHDLLLESAKKIKDANKESMMDVDDTNVGTNKKAKSKKRCSTPRKRKVTKKSIAPTVEPVVEEHVESCSYSGRKSCPPLFQTIAADENIINQEIASLTIDDKKTKGKARKKKDIIRVKIQRPKSKKSDEKLKALAAHNASKISIYTDSGINESGVFLPIDDSVDLIHNHSETCLHANDCVGDSVEFIENSKSVITLNDSTKSIDNLWNSRSDYDDAENISPEFFCNNAQDVNSFYKSKSIFIIIFTEIFRLLIHKQPLTLNAFMYFHLAIVGKNSPKYDTYLVVLWLDKSLWNLK